jgi:PhzF family phenazine biosynthesis protein
LSFPLFVVDAFTDRPFSGNPAAVCLLPAWPEKSWLQAVAAEMNLSETAFLVKTTNGFDLRWFTPAVEVDLCGHATLASAHVIWHHGYAEPGGQLSFATRSGALKAQQRDGEIELDFPLTPAKPEAAPPGLIEALGIAATYVGKNRFDYLIEVESDAAVRLLKPDFKRLATLPMRGVIVTAKSSDPQFDFVSRFFAPGAGIDEDPVTGSAHCCLGDHWRRRLGKNELLAFQASRRGGIVRVRVTEDRAYLAGKAVTISKGELLAEPQK